MNAGVLKLLLAGEYICPIRYRNEYELLEDPQEREETQSWLLAVNMRLARLGDEGAYFMAPDVIGASDVTRIRTELKEFRDNYGPAVLLLDFIRQSDVGGKLLVPGEYVVLHELERAVSQSSVLETQLKGLVNVITSAAMRNSNHENLRRLLDHLQRDGYVILANKENSAYQVTGKIDQLYAVLQFLDENKVVPDQEIDDLEDALQGDLLDQGEEGVP
ncbi:hypothetical protein [Variovorax guangxiensis]|uniref:hypothetical protein n=1 Tax=Variovorax guangxiensis TaxID=1775474 RepID=UPI00285674C1|nr:hypothetical protein [Variovorax guangxiensis]MDR6861433.1 hypothetical protein [Variovorax guangxiensis]